MKTSRQSEKREELESSSWNYGLQLKISNKFEFQQQLLRSPPIMFETKIKNSQKKQENSSYPSDLFLIYVVCRCIKICQILLPYFNLILIKVLFYAFLRIFLLT